VIVVDSSAIVAIVRHESEAEKFAQVLDVESEAIMSAVSLLETNMVVAGRRADADPRQVALLLASLGIAIADVDNDQSARAVDAFFRFGKGRHPARLNLADCFAYALAKSRDVPLLFKGDDFARTDVVPAWRP
jgi:ribonuclease VapC